MMLPFEGFQKPGKVSCDAAAEHEEPGAPLSNVVSEGFVDAGSRRRIAL
jgi:hypothetical protein